MAGTLTVDTIQSDSSYASTLNVASKMNFSAGMQIGGQDTTFGGMRNRIINGNMIIDQRNAGANSTSVGYTVDRWYYAASQSSKGTWQQREAQNSSASNYESGSAPNGFKNSLKFTSSSAYTVGSSDYFEFYQAIEGYNITDLDWGSSTAKPVTLSFWVKCSLIGTFSGAIQSSGANRSYPFTYTISSPNTWEQKTITIPGDTSGTWLTTNGVGMYVLLNLGSGSNYTSAANTWVSGNYNFVSGSTSVVGTNAATFYITGVQLEKGSTASAFEQLHYTHILALCQRYFQKVDNGGSGNGYTNFGNATSYSSGVDCFRVQISLPVKMRTFPSFSTTGAFVTLGAVAGSTTVGLADGGGNPVVGLVLGISAASTGQTVIFRANNDTTAALNFSAEL